MNDEVRVTIKMLSMGLRLLECVVRKDITVGDLKQLIEKTDPQNTAADLQRLLYDNKELTDDTIMMCDLKPPIKEGSQFTLVLKLDRSQLVKESVPTEAATPTCSDGKSSTVAPVQPSTVWFQVRYETSRHNVSCDSTDTVLVLKSLVWEKTDVPPENQRLVCNGSVFEDTSLIGSYNLGTGLRGRRESEPVFVTLVKSICGFAGLRDLRLGQSQILKDRLDALLNRTS
eukprot:TRINITY_DN9709_c0_g1_i1.p1 TRINITY_DN9709_c0_g1~~TRINITY_DN9709_c0_g1_i1.p1  ORF type:complete len:229 (+),score=38.17 TRINITY_DN9709_c0_g1_i1:256-942(+)